MRIFIDWTVRLSKGVYTDPGDVDLEYFIDGKLHETVGTPVQQVHKYGLLSFCFIDIGLIGCDYHRAPCLWRETQSGKESWHVSADD